MDIIYWIPTKPLPEHYHIRTKFGDIHLHRLQPEDTWCVRMPNVPIASFTAASVKDAKANAVKIIREAASHLEIMCELWLHGFKP